ncbi:MAG TPA: hypothetical protein EYG51_26030 [Pseudomonadales bacterium]|nr:hypothetical protein [Pseudomonadales bacterium]
MIKIGDKVSPFDNMSKTGVVVDMHKQKSNQWMIGGAMEGIFIVDVRLDKDGAIERFRADQLMRLE